jgi:SagB-type dehydrogenase family enzyme
MDEYLDQVVDYHQATKHSFGRFARGPAYLDWETQPDPFRHYRGAAILELEKTCDSDSPPYDTAFAAGGVEPADLNRHTVSQLFFDSLAISAWKRAGNASWALRVNPSSGNLHPTESYLLSGPIDGLCKAPIVAHYSPRNHELEIRTEVPEELWRALTRHLPQGTVLIGLSSIHWREAWKYGERAFRYCQHDVGHALAAIGIAAAGLGWQTTLLDEAGTDQLARLLGLEDAQDAEREHPDCLLAVYPRGHDCGYLDLQEPALRTLSHLSWFGQPNVLSPSQVHWPWLDRVTQVTAKPPTDCVRMPAGRDRRGRALSEFPLSPYSLRRVIRKRRSAVAMDGQSSIGRDAFHKMLYRTLPWSRQQPFAILPWAPMVHLAVFVHRVQDLEPGLYVLLRDPGARASLQSEMWQDFAWDRLASSPGDLDLYHLASGDFRAIAKQLSCSQDIAADGCFSLSMIAAFEKPLQRYGPWFYQRLYWECGMIGQVLYLEAEAGGMRGTGIGCFFDDPVHQLLGLENLQYQSLYHFTIGFPIEDSRLTTLEAYPAT